MKSPGRAAGPGAIGFLMPRAIVGFHLDDEGQWAADLACGHGQHVRHKPPFVERPWAMTATGRQARLGSHLPCKLCED